MQDLNLIELFCYLFLQLHVLESLPILECLLQRLLICQFLLAAEVQHKPHHQVPLVALLLDPSRQVDLLDYEMVLGELVAEDEETVLQLQF